MPPTSLAISAESAYTATPRPPLSVPERLAAHLKAMATMARQGFKQPGERTRALDEIADELSVLTIPPSEGALGYAGARSLYPWLSPMVALPQALRDDLERISRQADLVARSPESCGPDAAVLDDLAGQLDAIQITPAMSWDIEQQIAVAHRKGQSVARLLENLSRVLTPQLHEERVHIVEEARQCAAAHLQELAEATSPAIRWFQERHPSAAPMPAWLRQALQALFAAVQSIDHRSAQESRRLYLVEVAKAVEVLQTHIASASWDTPPPALVLPAPYPPVPAVAASEEPARIEIPVTRRYLPFADELRSWFAAQRARCEDVGDQEEGAQRVVLDKVLQELRTVAAQPGLEFDSMAVGRSDLSWFPATLVLPQDLATRLHEVVYMVEAALKPVAYPLTEILTDLGLTLAHIEISVADAATLDTRVAQDTEALERLTGFIQGLAGEMAQVSASGLSQSDQLTYCQHLASTLLREVRPSTELPAPPAWLQALLTHHAGSLAVAGQEPGTAPVDTLNRVRGLLEDICGHLEGWGWNIPYQVAGEPATGAAPAGAAGAAEVARAEADLESSVPAPPPVVDVAPAFREGAASDTAASAPAPEPASPMAAAPPGGTPTVEAVLGLPLAMPDSAAETVSAPAPAPAPAPEPAPEPAASPVKPTAIRLPRPVPVALQRRMSFDGVEGNWEPCTPAEAAGGKNGQSAEIRKLVTQAEADELISAVFANGQLRGYLTVRKAVSFALGLPDGPAYLRAWFDGLPLSEIRETWPEAPGYVDLGELQPPVASLAAALDEADRRAGAAERQVEDLRETAVARDRWIADAREAAGYGRNVSFDVVWDETLALAQEARRARSLASRDDGVSGD